MRGMKKVIAFGVGSDTIPTFRALSVHPPCADFNEMAPNQRSWR